MQISVTGHHVEVTESMRAYVLKKMDRVVRHFDHVLDVHYVLSVEKLRHKAEATLKVSGGDIHAVAEAGHIDFAQLFAVGAGNILGHVPGSCS